MSFSLAELATRLGCDVRGDSQTQVSRVATLPNAVPGTITFLANPRYRHYLAETSASAVVLDEKHAADCPVASLIAANPYAIYARIAALLHPVPDFSPGVHQKAVVDPSAVVAESANIGPMAVVQAGARIAERVRIGPGCVVGADCMIGAESRLVANVTLCEQVTLGSRVIVHPGVVIGADGFGIAQDDGAWIKVPQVGSVQIGNDVEIGANTTIDRGAIEDTVIEDGVKLDNQIQVAHNVRIGEHTVVAACVGISGSTVIGKRCMIGGAVGFVGHLSVTDDVVITGLTMVSRSISEPGVYSGGLPMDEAQRWRKNSARFRKLDELARQVRNHEKALARMSQATAGKSRQETD